MALAVEVAASTAVAVELAAATTELLAVVLVWY